MKISQLLLIICCFLISACNTPEKSPIEYVNPFIGTGFHGHTYPGATTPFGGVQLSPDTRKGGWDGCSGYHYSDSTLLGFSHTHLSGTGCADLADVLIRPTTRPIQLSKGKEFYSPTRFFHFQEKARPGYYAVELPEEQIKAELTATPHAGMHRYSFQQGKNATIIIDLAHSIADWEEIYESSLQQNGVNEISGMRRTLSWVDNQHLYFVAQFSAPIQHIEYIQEREKMEGVEELTGSNIQGILHFGQLPELTVKVGISLVSIENARDNLNKEIPHFLFDSTRQQAENLWAQALSKIKIKGGNKAQRINFYTACYHSLLAPNIVSDLNHEYRKHDMTIGKMASYRKMYSTLSLWDTFRAWHPLMTLMDTTMVNDIVQSMLNIYDASGELPIWPLASGETRTMIGYHAASVIADAYLKGICRYDADKALKAMVVSSEINKKNAAEYIQHGYIPSNRRESVSCMLEYAYDDWAIAQMAKALGNEELYHRYIQRSQNYPLVFDGSTRFFRAKRQDGNWEENFNPEAVGREYTEATAWQYRFFVPHDVYGMVQLFGNEEEFEKALDSLFNTSKAVDGHAVDISGLIGQYAHGNEPSHHIAYLYSYIGKPWKTQQLTRKILNEMYLPTPEGICGNEDCGQMSAWYIFSALGFYPVCPGSNEFVLTSPLFEEAELQLANGKRLTITANQPDKNTYIARVTLNGIEISGNFVTYEQLMQGGELRYELTNKPNIERGTSLESSPYSYSKEKRVSIPSIPQDLNLFMDQVTFHITSATEGCQIHYTLDGTEPTEQSPRYTSPITLKESKTIKAKAFKEGFLPSYTQTIKATKSTPRPARAAIGKKQGTRYIHVFGKFSKVAELSQAPIVSTGILSEPSLKPALREDQYGFIFSGMILVPEDGMYTFVTKSDDGSMLFIDNEMVVDNDGSHSAVAAMGKIPLKKGFHSYRLLYLEDYEGQELSWSWKLPSKETIEPIPASALFIN